MTSKKNIINTILLCLAIVLISFLHLFRLMEVPFGLNIDEAGSCYDAWCLVNFGTDRYGNAYPVYFINYGGGQNALLTYILAIAYKLFGYHDIIVRLIMALIAFVTAFFGYKLIKNIREEKTDATLFLLLYAIMPICIMLFRIGVESTLMICFAVIFLYYFWVGLEKQKRLYYFLAGISGGLMLYTYALTYIVMPLMLVISFAYIMYIRKGSRIAELKRWIIMGIPMAILAAPLIAVQFINMLDLPQMMMGPFTLTKLMTYRGAELSLSNPLKGLFSVFRYVCTFDPLTYNTISTYGTLYYISIPFIVYGLIWCIKKTIYSCKQRELDANAIMLAWFVAECLMGCLLTENSPPFTSRMNGIYIVVLYFLVVGIVECGRKLDVCAQAQGSIEDTERKLKGNIRFKIYVVALTIIYSVGFISFATYYFGDYTDDTYPLDNLFCKDYGEVVEFLNGEGSIYANMPLYLENKFIYYVLPAQVYVQGIGVAVDGISEYGNAHFGFPEKTDFSGNYVVYEKEQQSRDYLMEKGYTEIPLGDYYFYASPICKLKLQPIENGLVTSQIDSMTFDKEGNFVLSGWAFMNDTLSACLEMEVKVCDNTIPVQMIERPDVAQVYGLSEDELYGFYVTVDKALFSQAEKLELIVDGNMVIVEVCNQ